MSRCRACNHRLAPFFSLGKMPLVNAFLKKEHLEKEKKFELTVAFCSNCYLVQLTKTVDPKDLFAHYLYFSSVTKSILDHSKKTATTFIKRFKLNKKSLVLEVGSNDGVHLQFYKKAGIHVLGIDPARNIAKIANEKGVKTIPDFFSLKLAKKLQKQQVKADLIYGANVFAHVPQIVTFLKGIKLILAEKGTLVFEFPYIGGLFEKKFDTIYHEHVFYYSMLALKNLFAQVDLEIYDVAFIAMQGGSLRIYCAHKKTFPIKESVKKLLSSEKKKGFDKLKTYKNIGKEIEQLKIDTIVYLEKLKKQKKHVVGYGAPAKGIILLNYFDIGSYLDFIVDKAAAKQGLYTPGVHMRIYPPSRIDETKPDYLFVFPWNITQEITKEWKNFSDEGGKFIVPIPKIKIL